MKNTFSIALVVLMGSLPATSVQAETCLECHDDAEFTMERDGQEISIAVHPGMFADTPHEDMDCTDCHAGLDEDDLPHADPLPLAVNSCLECHEDLGASHLFHARFKELDEDCEDCLQEESIRCDSCHGTHHISYVEDSDFPFAKDQQTSRCGECHEEESINYLRSAHAFEKGGEKAPTCLVCHTSELITGEDGFAGMPKKIRLAELCMECHVDDPDISGQTLYGTPFITSFGNSVHGKALYSGNEDAPTCIDCHDSHIVGSATATQSRVSHGQVVASCSKCHAPEAEAYLQSIHAKVMGMGYDDSPDCTDCHGEHGILAHSDPDSPVASMNLTEQVCGECHGSVRLSERFGMETDRLETFEDSFHGLAARGGAVEAVNCASCHGYHDVRADDDPKSMTYPANLAKTCGQCHEGANERFSIGKVHVSIDATSTEPVVYWIAKIYIWGIFLIVGGMFLHNALDFFHKVREKAGTHWRHYVHESADIPHRLYLRLTLNERIQHASLALSFCALVITGFMLRYPDSSIVVLLRDVSSNLFEWRGLIHRVAGIVMCISGFWHIAYVTFTKRGRQVFKDLLPRMKDLSDMKGVLLFNLGLAKERPLFERFSYIEKAEYWALLWGSIVMTVTGFMLWFVNLTIGSLTLLGFDIALTIHFYEAVLATLAIIVWHIYFVIFNPDVYPMNLSWLTGHLSEEEMETEHPLELQRLKAKEAAERKSIEEGEDSEELAGSPGDDE